MRLELSKCVVRLMQLNDAPGLARHGNNPNVSANNNLPLPMTLDAAQQWLEARLNQSTTVLCAIEVDWEVVGAIGLTVQPGLKSHSAEIGFWLGEKYWNKGITTEAVRAFTEYGFTQHGLSRIYAHVFSWNAASMRVLEKCGYQREGWLRQSVVKGGKLVDQAFYAKLRDDH
jgi:RimJ/RimL family protein N-acetyltransferase